MDEGSSSQGVEKRQETRGVEAGSEQKGIAIPAPAVKAPGALMGLAAWRARIGGHDPVGPNTPTVTIGVRG